MHFLNSIKINLCPPPGLFNKQMDVSTLKINDVWVNHIYKVILKADLNFF